MVFQLTNITGGPHLVGIYESMLHHSYGYLVGGFKHLDYFPFHIWNVILPIDELIFFRGVGIPPTSYIMLYEKNGSTMIHHHQPFGPDSDHS